MSDPAPLMRVKGIHRSFKMGTRSLPVLRGIDLEIQAGEDLCIVGTSGSGKSTFLHILGTLDRPTLGRVFYRDVDLVNKSDRELAEFRNKSLGFVFQFHHLLSEFSAVENVALPLRIGGASAGEAQVRAEKILEYVGLTDRLEHFPSELSGGEKQRVAIARALVGEPEIILADEPTGNLDSENSLKIQELFFTLKRELQLTLVVVTHESQFAGRFSTVKRLKDGVWDESFRSKGPAKPF